MADRGTSHSNSRSRRGRSVDPPTVAYFRKRAKRMPDGEAQQRGDALRRDPMPPTAAGGVKHAYKLFIVAREAGFASWEALIKATDAERQAAIDRPPVPPAVAT